MKIPRLLPLLLPALLVAPLAAQDVIIQPAVLFNTSDKPGTPPVLEDNLKIEYPADMAKADVQGYAIVAFTTQRTGPDYMNKIYVRVAGSDAAFEKNVRDTFRLGVWPKINPRLNGKSAKAYSWAAIIFNPASAAGDIPNATVRLLKAAPVFVTTAQWNSLPKDEKILRGSIAIDDSGAPQQITLETKSASAQALLPDIQKSVAQWTFAPARTNGQSVAAVIKTTFIPMTVPNKIDDIPSNITRPRPISQPNPYYPADLRRQGITGEVTVAFFVNKDGKTENVEVIKSTNKDFGDAAMAAVKKWRFKPASIDGVPVKSDHMTITLAFALP